MATNETEILCDAAVDSYSDGYMVWIRIVQLVSFLFAIPPAVVACVCIAKAGALHSNMRILLTNLFISTIVTNTGIVVTAVYHLVAFAQHQNEEQFCDLVAMTATDCARLNALFDYGGFTTVNGLIVLAIERIYATTHFKTYERVVPLRLGIGLALAQWIVSIPSLPITETSNQRYPICEGELSRPESSGLFMGAMLTVELISLFIFISLVFANKRKIGQYNANVALQRLSVRYQLKENMNTTKLMIPISVVSCVIFFLTLFALLFLVRNLPGNGLLTQTSAKIMTNFGLRMELIKLASPLSAIFFCVAILYSPHIRQTAKSLLRIDRYFTNRPNRVSDTAIIAEHSTKLYFDALRKQWEMSDVSK